MMAEDRTSVELPVDDLRGKTVRELRDRLEALVPDVGDRGVSVLSTHYVTSVRIDFSYSSLPASGEDLTRATALTVAALHAWGQVNCPHRALSSAWWLKLRPNVGRHLDDPLWLRLSRHVFNKDDDGRTDSLLRALATMGATVDIEGKEWCVLRQLREGEEPATAEGMRERLESARHAREEEDAARRQELLRADPTPDLPGEPLGLSWCIPLDGTAWTSALEAYGKAGLRVIRVYWFSSVRSRSCDPNRAYDRQMLRRVPWLAQCMRLELSSLHRRERPAKRWFGLFVPPDTGKVMLGLIWCPGEPLPQGAEPDPVALKVWVMGEAMKAAARTQGPPDLALPPVPKGSPND